MFLMAFTIQVRVDTCLKKKNKFYGVRWQKSVLL